MMKKKATTLQEEMEDSFATGIRLMTNIKIKRPIRTSQKVNRKQVKNTVLQMMKKKVTILQVEMQTGYAIGIR